MGKRIYNGFVIGIITLSFSLIFTGCEKIEAQNTSDTNAEHGVGTITEEKIGTGSEINDNQNNNQGEEKSVKIKKEIPSFKTVIDGYKNNIIEGIDKLLENEVKTLKKGNIETDGNFKISGSYGTSNGSLTFEYSGSIDEALKKIFGYFYAGVELQQGLSENVLLPKHLNVGSSIKIFLDDNVFNWQLDNVKLDGIKEMLEDEENEDGIKKLNLINRFIERIKGKWVELKFNELCDEESENYSEVGCEMINNIEEYKDYLSGSVEKDEKINKKLNEMTEFMKKTIKEEVGNFITTDILISPRIVNYSDKEAYKFEINEETLKENLKKLLMKIGTYTFEQSKEITEELGKIDNDDYGDFEENKQETLAEMEEKLDDALEKISIKKFEGYLVYDETKGTFNLVIEELSIGKKTITTDYVYEDSKEIVDTYYEDGIIQPIYKTPTYTEQEIIREDMITFAYSSIKQTLGIIYYEEDEVDGMIMITYGKNGEDFNYKVSITPKTGGELLNNGIIVNVSGMLKRSEDMRKNNINIDITIKKDLLKLENDINISLGGRSNIIIGKAFKGPSITTTMELSRFLSLVNALKEQLGINAKERDNERKSNLYSLGSNIINYYNDKEKLPGEIKSNKLIEAKEIAKEMKDLDYLIPTDPDKNNSFIQDNERISNGQYGYKIVEKNGEKNKGFILIANTETENGSNYLSSIRIPNDISNLKACRSFKKGNTSSKEVPDNGICEYVNENELRYVYSSKYYID